MTRYQLAKLVVWSERIDSRKRMQKMVYLLQSGGCSLKTTFFLHHYGPYSQEVANICDEMVASELLLEQQSATNYGTTRYAYVLSEPAEPLLAQHEKNPVTQSEVEGLSRFEDLTRQLAAAELWVLELASTVAYYHDRNQTWEDSIAQAAEYKKIKPTDPMLSKAVKLAERVFSFKESHAARETSGQARQNIS